MPEIPSDVCHIIIGGMAIGILAMGKYIVSLQTRNDNMQEHLNKTNENLTNLLMRRRNG